MTRWSQLLDRPAPTPARATLPATVPPARVTDTGAGMLVAVIRRTVELADGPVTQFDIARTIARTHPNRWSETTIRRRVTDAGLTIVDCEGLSPQWAPCWRYTLPCALTDFEAGSLLMGDPR